VSLRNRSFSEPYLFPPFSCSQGSVPLHLLQFLPPPSCCCTVALLYCSTAPCLQGILDKLLCAAAPILLTAPEECKGRHGYKDVFGSSFLEEICCLRVSSKRKPCKTWVKVPWACQVSENYIVCSTYVSGYSWSFLYIDIRTRRVPATTPGQPRLGTRVVVSRGSRRSLHSTLVITRVSEFVCMYPSSTFRKTVLLRMFIYSFAGPESLTDGGDPCSLVLFNYHIDDLARAVASAHTDAPALCGVPMPLLLHADDVALLSYSLEGIRRALSAAYTARPALATHHNPKRVPVLSIPSLRSLPAPPRYPSP